MKVIGYIRVSTEGQEESGLGLKAQEAKIQGYCELYDLELVGIRMDAASGKNVKRPGLQDALCDLKDGGAEGLIVAKLDRLTRSVRDLGELLEDYFRDASLVVVTEQVDTRTAAGRLVLNLLTSVAQWERETIGERTKDALKAKRRNGQKTGGDIPFGYSLGDDGKTLVENPQEQEIIRLMQSLRGKGYTNHAIALFLNERGHKTKRGKNWTNVQVTRTLQKAA